MATAAGLILSAIGTGVSLISFATGNLRKSEGASTKVTIACAEVSPANADDSVDGKVDIRLYNTYAEQVGPPVIDQYVNRGNTAYEITYDHDGEYDGNQTPYIKVTGNNDAICIAWLTVTWADGTDWIWSGDWGRSCGYLPWHHNDAVLGDIKQSDEGGSGARRPTCSWIDGDGSVGGDTTAFSVYLPYFTTNNDGSDVGRGNICHNPTFSTYNNDDGNGLSYYSPPPDISNINNYDGRKRDAAVEPQAINATPNTPIGRLYTQNNTELIMSHREQHSAVELCESDSSWGASFVSYTEGKFCDMSTKTLYDVCAPGQSLIDANCFDTDLLGLRGLKSLVEFNWLKVKTWGGENPLQWASEL